MAERLWRLDGFLRDAAGQLNAAAAAAAGGADAGALPLLGEVLGSQAASIRAVDARARELEVQLAALGG